MPSLNPNVNFELKLIERKNAIVNPFNNLDCQDSCNRVLAFIQHIQDKFTFDCANNSKNGEDFFLTMPTIAAFESQIYLFEAINFHATNQISDTKIKEFLENYIAAHTVIWSNGIPSAKIGLYGNWTTKTDLFQIKLIANNTKKETVIVNELQFEIIKNLWIKKDKNNKIEIIKL